MADDNTLQNRPSNPQPTAPAGQGNTDPLTELARLIGQNDPFADFGRAQLQQAQQQRPQPSEPRPMPPQPQFAEQAPPSFLQAGHSQAAYHEHAPFPPQHEFDIETEPSGHGRKFMTMTAVVVLAVIGIGGAFGYRFIFGGSSTTTPPPVIRANPDPAKVPPPAATADAAQGKSTYDRAPTGTQDGRVVAREETPVDVNSLARPGVGRSPPTSSGPNPWASASAPNPPPSGSSAPAAPIAPSAMGEPKRVRTVTIRPDQADTMAQSSLAPPSASPLPPAPPTRSAPPAAAAPVQRAPAAIAPPAAPPANAPLSLNDDSSLTLPRSLNAPPSAPAQPRQAPVQRAAPAPQPQQQSVAQLAAPRSGGFLVQVSSQRNEAEAQAALRSAQSKFPSVLGGQPGTVRRADLGERGTYYRAMIGPYGSRDEANQLCASLKAAGGTCIVQAN
jgi:SPOR domain